MAMNDFARDKESNTEARECLLAFAFNAIETFEYPLMVFFVYPNTIILHPDTGKFFISLHKHLDAISVRRIFYCVGQKIHNHLRNSILICNYFPFKFITDNDRVF